MDKASVTSPIDFTGAILEILGNTNIQKGYRGGMTFCVRSWPRRQIPLGSACYQLSIKVNCPYLSYILYL